MIASVAFKRFSWAHKLSDSWLICLNRNLLLQVCGNKFDPRTNHYNCSAPSKRSWPFKNHTSFFFLDLLLLILLDVFLFFLGTYRELGALCVPGAVFCAAAADVTECVYLWPNRRVSQCVWRRDRFISQPFLNPVWTHRLRTIVVLLCCRVLTVCATLWQKNAAVLRINVTDSREQTWSWLKPLT